MNGYLCANGWENTLCRELAAQKIGENFYSPAPGLVVGESRPASLKYEPIFARQWLPNCCEIKGSSIAELIQALGISLDPVLDNNPLPWTLHCYTPDFYCEDSEHYEFLSGRAALLHEKFMQRMTKFRKRTFEKYKAWEDIDEKKPCLVVQAVLTGIDSLWVSTSKRTKTELGRFVPFMRSMIPGSIPTDPQAPCRSYYKLEEAWQQAGIHPRRGETCVDLGAAPGGWTWAALKRGARVIAVDFADLKPHVEKHPNCEHSIDNGYAFMPSRKADWMFCDMIVRPMATIGLLERWLKQKACRRFVVNVKYRGKEPETILAAIEELRVQYEIRHLIIRHLYHDRNEITLIGEI
ncbi:MAG: SAM-dependent methyltransferase [Candidatus Rifleibacteriota bacterium]